MEGAFHTAANARADAVIAPRLPGWQQPVAIVGMLLATAMLTGLAVWSQSLLAPRPLAQFVLVTPPDGTLSARGPGSEVAISPDGTRVVYASGNATATRQLYVREVASNNPILLDSVQTLLCCVAWSPDGTQIAYQRGASGIGSTVVTPRLPPLKA